MVATGLLTSHACRKWLIIDQHSVMLYLHFVQISKLSFEKLLLSPYIRCGVSPPSLYCGIICLTTDKKTTFLSFIFWMIEIVYYASKVFSWKLIKIWNSKLQFFVMKTPSVSLPFNLSLLIALTKRS